MITKERYQSIYKELVSTFGENAVEGGKELTNQFCDDFTNVAYLIQSNTPIPMVTSTFDIPYCLNILEKDKSIEWFDNYSSISLPMDESSLEMIPESLKKVVALDNENNTNLSLSYIDIIQKWLELLTGINLSNSVGEDAIQDDSNQHFLSLIVDSRKLYCYQNLNKSGVTTDIVDMTRHLVKMEHDFVHNMYKDKKIIASIKNQKYNLSSDLERILQMYRGNLKEPVSGVNDVDIQDTDEDLNGFDFTPASNNNDAGSMMNNVASQIGNNGQGSTVDSSNGTNSNASANTNNNSNSNNAGNRKIKPKNRKKHLGGIVAIFIVVVVIVFLSNKSKDESSMSVSSETNFWEENAQATSEENFWEENAQISNEENYWEANTSETSMDTSGAVEDVENNIPDDTLLAQFNIQNNIQEDYQNATDLNAYARYDSGISDFNFCYPTNLYNNVTVNTNEECEYGTILQDITFSGSGGSELIFRIIDRNDKVYRTIDQATEYIHSSEVGQLYEPADIINSATNDHGKVIVTGWDSALCNYAVYDMVKIEGDYYLQMKVIYPEYISDYDKDCKFYVTECLYRMCGFSDSKSTVRSFEEYRESGE